MNIEDLPAGWMNIHNVEALQKIAHSMKRTDFTVLEIGCFLGRSTLQWFSPYSIAKKNKKGGNPPKVMCIDMFDYKQIPVAAKKELESFAYNINWNGNMQKDFCANVQKYLPHIEVIKAKYPNQYRIDPELRFDIIFIDASPVKEVIRDILNTVNMYAIPYRTLICGPHYSSTYAPQVVDEVNKFCGAIRGRLESFPPSNIWGIKVQGN